MKENDALEILARHYYCEYNAVLIRDETHPKYDDRNSEKRIRVLDFECEHCGAKWCVAFDVDE